MDSATFVEIQARSLVGRNKQTLPLTAPSVAKPTVNEQTRRKLLKVRLCSSGSTLRDLVPAYANNPG